MEMRCEGCGERANSLISSSHCHHALGALGCQGYFSSSRAKGQVRKEAERTAEENAVDSGTPQTVFFILKVVHVGFAVKMRNPPSPFSCWCPKLIFWHHNCVANYVLIIFHACLYLLWNFAMKQPRPIRERARVLKTCVPIYTCTSHPSGIWTSVTIILF